MSARAGVCLCLAVTLLSACGYGSGQGAVTDKESPSPTFDTATAIIEGGEEPVLVRVEVAQTDEQRKRGLMGRRHLDADAGMIFLYFEPTDSSFWMKNTHIPLSIAFFDRAGRIVDILDMEPCRAEPCPSYYPDEPYFGALEVNAGAFQRWGVSEGDIVRMNQ
jgi:uncharacterized protein